jgi:hypothetical protein
MDWAPGGDIRAITYDLKTESWSNETLLLLSQVGPFLALKQPLKKPSKTLKILKQHPTCRISA